MPACELKPEDKKAFVSDVGKRLVHEYGKKKHYKSDQIRKAAQVWWAACSIRFAQSNLKSLICQTP
jgi:hypothetical protein